MQVSCPHLWVLWRHELVLVQYIHEWSGVEWRHCRKSVYCYIWLVNVSATVSELQDFSEGITFFGVPCISVTYVSERNVKE